MASSVVPGWHGHDYQARFFWIRAAALRNPQSAHVVEVSYEADGPKAFDDVIVKYDPPRPGTGGFRVSVDYHQIKFHAVQSGRFGYSDLTDPAFIGAKSFSILQRLQTAKATAPAHSAFHLVTTDGISDGDQLNDFISNNDYSIRLDKLFDGTTDASRMGEVRKCWRDHLMLSNDDELRDLVSGLHIASNQPSLTRMRDDVNLHFDRVGLVTCEDTVEFRFDATAKALKAGGRYTFSRGDFEALCQEEGWVRPKQPEPTNSVSVRSLGERLEDHLEAHPDNQLALLDMFDGRHLRPEFDWNSDIKTKVVDFLRAMRRTQQKMRLFLDAHISIAFLAGSILGLKSGADIDLWQKGGRAAPANWRADDGKSGLAPNFEIIDRQNGGKDVALVVSLTRGAKDAAVGYIERSGIPVGRIIHAVAAGGPSQTSVAGGTHAADLSDAIADAVQNAKLPPDATIHIFITAPNAFSFFLGQQREAMGRCMLYEFDMGNTIDGSYRPTIRIP